MLAIVQKFSSLSEDAKPELLITCREIAAVIKQYQSIKSVVTCKDENENSYDIEIKYDLNLILKQARKRLFEDLYSLLKREKALEFDLLSLYSLVSFPYFVAQTAQLNTTFYLG